MKEADPEFGEALEKYGRRNIACLTIAPTGTVSLMTQTSSGIEPVFLAIYKRRRKINPTDTCSKVDFVDENGDSFEEFLVIHPKFKVWMEMNDIHMESNASQEEIDSLVKLSPYYKSTSNDIDWLQKVKMQGRIQKWVDHSISVTINLPKMYPRNWLTSYILRHGDQVVRVVLFTGMVLALVFWSPQILRMSRRKPREHQATKETESRGCPFQA